MAKYTDKTKSVHNMHEAKTHLSQLVERALQGEEIVIGRAGKGLVKLVPMEEKKPPRVPGRYEGQIWISDDFDDPLPEEIMKYFRGEGD
jgi:prevent-host-death family protein